MTRGPHDLSAVEGAPFGTVLADPPWRFAHRTGKISPEYRRHARYRTMSTPEIAALPVAAGVTEDAHLYLWVPNALLADGLAVMQGWGFTYKANLVWHKVLGDGRSDRRGVGFYFRNVTELVLFGVRGSLRTLPPGRRQVNLFASRKREHSRKPEQLYDIVESCSPGPYLEMFARHPRLGWTAWGDEATEPAEGGCATIATGMSSSAGAGTIVVVEDDPNIADLVELYLRQEGFRVVQAGDGESGLEAVRSQKPRLVILDVGLPGGIDGLEVCRRLRVDNLTGIRGVPIIVLTARGEEIDRVLGLELGADDYVPKPFLPRELVARVRALLRRSGGMPRDPAAPLMAGEVEVDCRRREARVGGTVVPLATPRVRPVAVPGRQHRARPDPPADPRRRVGRGLVRRPAHDRRPRPPAAQEARRGPPAGHGVGCRLPAGLTPT